MQRKKRGTQSLHRANRFNKCVELTGTRRSRRPSYISSSSPLVAPLSPPLFRATYFILDSLLRLVQQDRKKKNCNFFNERR